MELSSKFSLRCSPGLESEYRSSRIDEEETNFGHLTFLNLTLCVSVASYFEHSQTGV